MLSGVRSAVASQATAHVEAATFVRRKLEMRLPEILEVMQVQTLNDHTDTYDSLLGRIYDTALQLNPVEHEERCLIATCHRISFMYSLLYEHDQLSSATHDTLHELFGVATTTAFKHLAQMVRARHLVDFKGRNVYMPMSNAWRSPYGSFMAPRTLASTRPAAK